MASESGPLVTAVIPTYGRPEFLDDAVRSVVDQTYDPLELVVVDDCSPDPVETRFTETDLSGLHDVRFLRHEENQGANSARNTGIRAADGEFIAFLDDDDRWRRTKIARQIQAFNKAGPDTGVVYTSLEIVDETEATIGTSHRKLHGSITRDLLCGASVGSFTRLMVRKGLLEEIGYLDEELPGWQDRDLNIRLSRRCRYEPITEPLAVHRRGSHEQIGNDYHGKRDVAYPRLVEKHRPLAAEFGKTVERRFLATQTLSLALSAISSGQARAARRHVLSSIRYDPTYWKLYGYLLLVSNERFFTYARSLKSTLRDVRNTPFGTSG
ncbi:glycosyltransferase family A protein [Halorubrum sp. CSM-61]|uniref:glycosyltransferase family 2 protein n=1 Tax=Halorubrum sp. CSM-61 TaxID=2485838 RepID=UPI000F4C008C|nr:glycosyltransferase family A protein [Halorubrum sp. CSM-61]